MNVLIVPDEGGQARRLNVPSFVVKFVAWLMFVILALIIVAIFGYGRITQRAFDWNRLAAENERLVIENQRLLKIARDVEESRQTLIKVVKTMQAESSSKESLRLPGVVSGAGELSEEMEAILREKVHTPEYFLSYGLPTEMPVKGFITQKFFQDDLLPERSHRGIDIAGKMGSPVTAAAAGRIVFEGWTPYFGNCIIIAHRNNFLTFYGHNKQNLAKVQEQVKRGEPVALLGSSGHSSAPHLHFEIWKEGEAVDPMKYLKME